MDTPGIPHFHLYGETERFDDPGFVHMETIESRSRLNNWEIAPHQHEVLDQMIVLRSGSVVTRIEGQMFNGTGPLVVHVPAATVHGFHFSDDVDGDVLTFATRLGHSVLPAHAPRGLLPDTAYLLPLDPGQLARITPPVDSLRIETSGHERGRIAAASWVVALLLLQVGRWQAERGAAADGQLPVVAEGDRDSRGTARARAFRQLVDRHFAEHRPLGFYADALALTEKTLARLCIARFGCTPQRYLHRRLLLEAQRMLVYGNATVAEIAQDLGFADPSYFTRFYRRMTGALPSANRAGQARLTPLPIARNPAEKAAQRHD
ncbi:helix-turn-helix domain-containing protein [Sphingobium algorifonticola]|uniref:Helix-turn-helix domain-containing protein n=1 Tax=Sphingobium algorifonticola TaxID=2008318 RepID=A0A437J9K0_9SPHN|nr:helix-turn-helix domain-containing protein [Sphingobium algorifonticola]RVT42189.1 helix-turn-helix domain-containing protein [Sphingobium algorifonticola]